MNLHILIFALLAPVWAASAALPLPPALAGEPTVVGQSDLLPLKNLPQHWMTWNLQWFPGQSPMAKGAAKTAHLLAVQKTVAKINPEVMILQEVVDAEALRRALPQYPWQAVTRFQRAEDENAQLPPQNVAMVSRIPWQSVWEVDFHGLPLTPDRPVRGFLAVQFQDKEGKKLSIYGVHLKSNRGGREASAKRRERAIEYLRTDWRARGLDPQEDAVLLAGDFNCSVHNPEFNEKTIRGLLREGWKLATSEIPWPDVATVKADLMGRYPESDFDHLLLSPGWTKVFGNESFKVRVVREEAIPSDHYPVEMRR